MGIDGTDKYGFSARPSGYRDENGKYIIVELISSWWNSVEKGANVSVWTIRLISEDIINYETKKNYGYSVRCIMDK